MTPHSGTAPVKTGGQPSRALVLGSPVLQIFVCQADWCLCRGFRDFGVQECGFLTVICGGFVVKRWFLDARIPRNEKFPRFSTLFF
jgi:hypothetical protein